MSVLDVSSGEMTQMDRRIIWVHGIGRHLPGYSDAWRAQFDRYLNLPAAHYLEVLWDRVFHPDVVGLRGAAIELSPQETLEAEEIRLELSTILGARKSALDLESSVAPATPRGATLDLNAPLEWSQAVTALDSSGAAARGIPPWLVDPGEYLGDFVKYLASRSVRTAVKEEFKRLLRPLAGSPGRLSVIAHSWGTVVAYESLLDLSVEAPALPVAHLFTLGSPLWLVRRFLEDRSGRKPGNVGTFVNVTARGDLIGSWLKPAFQVDRDYQVPSVGPDAHGSYFVAGNEQVQRIIIATEVLSDDR